MPLTKPLYATESTVASVGALPGTQFTYTDAAAVSAEGEQPTDARGLVSGIERFS